MGAPLAVYDHGDGNNGTVGDIAFSPDGRYLVAVGDPTYVWDLSTDPPKRYPLMDHGEPMDIGEMAIASDIPRMYTIGNHGPIRIWDLPARRIIATIPGDFAALNNIAVSPDGRLLATSDSRLLTVRLWDLDKRKMVATINTGHADIVFTVAFSPHGPLFASGGYDPDPRLWNSATRAPVGAPLKGHAGSIFALAFSPDGKTLAGGGDRTVRLWDIDSQQPIGQPLAGHTSDIRSITFSRDGRLLATGGSDGTVRFWRMTPTTDLPATMCRIAGRPLKDTEWHRYAPGKNMPSICN
jgi:WD40 repeat protein